MQSFFPNLRFEESIDESICLLMFTCCTLTSISPASIFEISTISLIILAFGHHFYYIETYSCCISPSVPVLSINLQTLEYHSLECISWLMLARKADFNRSDSSACSLAFNNSIPVSLMFCISVHVPNHLITFPFFYRALLELTTKISTIFMTHSAFKRIRSIICNGILPSI
jgi:hypothetical protein